MVLSEVHCSRYFLGPHFADTQEADNRTYSTQMCKLVCPCCWHTDKEAHLLEKVVSLKSFMCLVSEEEMILHLSTIHPSTHP